MTFFEFFLLWSSTFFLRALVTFSLNVIAAFTAFFSSSLLRVFSAFYLASGLVPAEPGGFLGEPFNLSSGLAGVWAELLGPERFFAKIFSEKSNSIVFILHSFWAFSKILQAQALTLTLL